MYDPKIKNLPKLIEDLEMTRDSFMEPLVLLKKIDDVEYEFDSSDGFEDVLDSIRPFLKKYCLNNKDAEYGKRLENLIILLKKEKSLEDLEEV